MNKLQSLPRSTPEAQGIPSRAISAFIRAAERRLDALHSFMLLRHGFVVAAGWWEPYQRRDQHMLFSLSKSFTSSAIGLLVAEGRLSIDDPVLAFFPAEAPLAPSANLQAMRVRHLLTMSTGHALDTTGPMIAHSSGNWVRGFLAQPVEHTPGTHFLYNTGATYLLAAIVQHLSGGRMLDYLQPRLFAPLGINDPHWETSPQGIDVGGWGLRTTTADIAAFGQLYLQQGLWQGACILPQAWITAATARQVANDPAPGPDWEQGYGYQFWRCRHDAYRGDGAFGQYCLVMSAQDAVLAITAGLGDMQLPLDLVWEHLLPTMEPAALPPDDAAQRELADKLARLRLPPVRGHALSPTATRVGGKTFVMAENAGGIREISFDFGAAETRITIRNDAGEQRIACGYDRWLRGAANLEQSAGSRMAPQQAGRQKVGVSGAWTDEQTYTAKLWWVETPFADTLRCRFEGDRLLIEQQRNVDFAPPEPLHLEGRPAGQYAG